MPYLSIATRSTPIPNAKPVYTAGIVADSLQDTGMHHSRAKDLDPVFVAIDRPLARLGVFEVRDRHIHPRLDEGEEVAPKAYLPVLAKGTSCKLVQRPFEVREGDFLVDREALDLVKVPVVRSVGRLVPVNLAGNDNPNRWTRLFHDSRLHRRCVGSQEHRVVAMLVHLVDPQGVEHVPCRMVGGNVQQIEVVAVELDLRPLFGLESHRGKGTRNLSHHPRRRVKAAL